MYGRAIVRQMVPGSEDDLFVPLVKHVLPVEESLRIKLGKKFYASEVDFEGIAGELVVLKLGHTELVPNVKSTAFGHTGLISAIRIEGFNDGVYLPDIN